MRKPAMLLAGLQAAATVGCMEIVQLLLPKVLSKVRAEVAAPAARGGRLLTLQTLRALQPPFPLPASLLEDAAVGGKRDILEYLQSPAGGGPHPWSDGVSTAAARFGHHALLKWLVEEEGCPFDRYAAGVAALRPAEIDFPSIY